MAQQILSTNTFTTAKWIVSATASDGTHTTIAAALTSAASGDTIFIRPGTYTENLTLKSGVNLTAFGCDRGDVSTTSRVIIVGKCTATFAGSCVITGIELRTNSDNCVVVSGSSATNVCLRNCYINCLNATGLVMSSSGGLLDIRYCDANLGTTGIGLYSLTGAGGLTFYWSRCGNSGASTTASAQTDGTLNILYSELFIVMNTSGTTAGFTFYDSKFDSGSTTTMTHGSTSSSSTIEKCFISSGSSSAISISASAVLNLIETIIQSSNTNVVTGAGTLNYSGVTFNGSSNVMNTTTQTTFYNNLGKYKAPGQPCFSAYSNTAVTNQTGDGTAYTIVFGTELFDQGSNFDGTSTFTAPVTGRYHFSIAVLSQNNLVTHNPNMRLVTTANTFTFGNFGGSFAGNFVLTGSVYAPMTAGDTAIVQCLTSNGTKTVGVYGAAGDPRTIFSGQLVA